MRLGLEPTIELKQDEISFHEGKRVFREDVNPEDVVRVIREKIIEMIKKLYEEEVQEEKTKYPENCFVFRFPTDAHFLPIFEKELFHILFEIRKNQKPDDRMQIDDYDLMTLDPSYSNMVRKLSTMHEIRGETLSEHEMRHAQADSDLFHTDSYISIFLKKIKEGQKTVLRIFGYALPQKQDASVVKTISSLMEPRNPSTHDFQQARSLSLRHDQYLREADRIYKIFFEEHIEPRLIHMGKEEKPISSNVVAAVMLQQWKELHGLA